MKAYLSTGRPLDPRTEATMAPALVPEALAEARAILAETEPAGGYLWRGPDYRNDLTGPGPEFQALAESLAAFVKE